MPSELREKAELAVRKYRDEIEMHDGLTNYKTAVHFAAEMLREREDKERAEFNWRRGKLIAAQANRLNEEKNAAEQQIASLQGRIEEAVKLLIESSSMIGCVKDCGCARYRLGKRIADFLTVPIAPENLQK